MFLGCLVLVFEFLGFVFWSRVVGCVFWFWVLFFVVRLCFWSFGFCLFCRSIEWLWGC